MTKAEQCARSLLENFSIMKATVLEGEVHLRSVFTSELSDFLQRFYPEESPDSVQITDRSHDATKSGDPFPY